MTDDYPPWLEEEIRKREEGDVPRADPIIKALNQKYMLDIIYYFKDHKLCLKSDLQRDISKCPSMGEKIQQLVDWGVIGTKDRQKQRYPYLYLTSKGEAVLAKLDVLLDLLGGNSH